MNQKAKHDAFLKSVGEVKEYFEEKFPSKKVEWDKLKKEFSENEFLKLRSVMFGHYRYFVKKVTESDIKIF